MPPDPQAETLKEVRALLAPLKRYKVEKVLGSGAMGSVVLVRHDVLGRRALKLINPNHLRSDILRRRFFNEARVMARLRGRHLVEVYEVDDVDGYPYIIMEYLEGGTLFDHLEAFGAMPARQAVQVTIALLEALEAAHTHIDEEGKLSPIVHRDVKAENVLITKSGTPKLGDFGIAHIEGGTRQLTGDVTTLGTLVYMAPEQRDGAKYVDGRADLYAVAVTLYIMVRNPNPEQLWRDAFHVTLARNPDMMDGVPESLQQIIVRAVAEKREDRYESAHAMASALRDAFASLPENPEETPKLGTAPEIESKRKAAHVDVLSAVFSIPNREAEGMTGVPVDESRSFSGGGLSSHNDEVRLRSVPPSNIATSSHAEAPVPNPWGGGTLHGGGTQSGTQFERELDVTRDAAKRKFYIGVGGIATVLVIVAVIIWTMTNMGESPPVVVDDPPVQEVQPPTQVVATPVQTSSEVVAPAPTPMIVAPVVKTEKKVAKAAASAVVKPPPEAASLAEKAQVRLILKEETVATVTLVGEGGTFIVSPADTATMVPPGFYQASVLMDGRKGAPQTGTLTITPGITTITCTAAGFQKCTGIK